MYHHLWFYKFEQICFLKITPDHQNYEVQTNRQTKTLTHYLSSDTSQSPNNKASSTLSEQNHYVYSTQLNKAALPHHDVTLFIT